MKHDGCIWTRPISSAGGGGGGTETGPAGPVAARPMFLPKLKYFTLSIMTCQSEIFR